MRYCLGITIAFLLLGAHNVYGTLKPQQWGASDVPTEWQEALSKRVTEMGALSNQSDRVQAYLALLHAVCSEEGLSPEDHRALVSQVKNDVFKGLLNEVKSTASSRESRGRDLSKYIMTATRLVRDLDVETQAGLEQAEQRLVSIMNNAVSRAGGINRSHLLRPDSREIPYAEYMRMRAEKQQVLEDARDSGKKALIVCGIGGALLVTALVITGAAAAIESAENSMRSRGAITGPPFWAGWFS